MRRSAARRRRWSGTRDATRRDDRHDRAHRARRRRCRPVRTRRRLGRGLGDRRRAPLRRLTPGSGRPSGGGERAAQELTIALVGAPGVNTAATPSRFSLLRVLRRDGAADDDEHVLGVFARSPSTIRGTSVMREENRDAHRVGVIPGSPSRRSARCLVEPRVDDLHPRIPQRSRDDLGAAVVSVQARLRDDHPNRPLHAVSIGTCVSSSSGRPRHGRTPGVPTPGTSSSRTAGACCSTAGPASSAAKREAEAWPNVERDRDHPLPPRPLGRPRLGVGQLTGGATTTCAPSSGSTGAAAPTSRISARLGFPDMFERTFVLHEYDAETPFRTAAELECCRCASRTTASRRTASA